MTNIDIVAIGQKRHLPNHENIEFENLGDYLKIVTKAVKAHTTPSQARSILENDDAMANLAHQVMLADWQYNGKGNRYGFRKSRIKFALKTYLTRTNNVKSKNVVSLDQTIRFKQETAQDCPDDIAIKREYSEKVWAAVKESNLSKTAKEYIIDYYLHGKKTTQIAREKKVTRQSVAELIKRSTKSLKPIFTQRGIIP